MPTPNEAYNSNSVEHGGFYAKFYRSRTSPALLGEYIVETADITDEVIEIDRPDVDGGDNGFVWVNGKTEGPATVQLASSSTPTIKNGDYFKYSKFSKDAAGAGETRYFVAKGVSHPRSTGDYRKQTLTLREDKHPSAEMESGSVVESTNDF